MDERAGSLSVPFPLTPPKLLTASPSPSAPAVAGYPDGVVKIEVFPDDPSHDSPTMDAARCNRISEHVLALRAPATPNIDARWASHLYPVHLTERYIKTQFRSDRTIRACL